VVDPESRGDKWMFSVIAIRRTDTLVHFCKVKTDEPAEIPGLGGGDDPKKEPGRKG